MHDLIPALLPLLPPLLLGMVDAPEATPFSLPSAPSPCPPWCAGEHFAEGDEHVSRTRTLRGRDGREIDVLLCQEGAGLARLALAITEQPGHCEATETELDPEAAVRLGLTLIALAAKAKETGR